MRSRSASSSSASSCWRCGDSAGNYLVDELSTPRRTSIAVQRTWAIMTRLLADAGWAAIVLGIVALVGVWLMGPSTRRHRCARLARAVPERARSSPSAAPPSSSCCSCSGARSPTCSDGPCCSCSPILAAVGVELLRRKAARDFPDAVAGGAFRAVAAARRASPTSSSDWPACTRARGPEDEEFAAAKARALAMDSARARRRLADDGAQAGSDRRRGCSCWASSGS